MKFIADHITNWNVCGLGIDFGTNQFIRKHRNNFFIEITVLFWTFAIEVRFSSK